MKAREIALSAYEQAVAAEEARLAKIEREGAEARRLANERHRQVFEAALVPLNLWFPGVKWDYEIAGDFRNDTIIFEKDQDQYPPDFKLKATRVHNPRDPADVNHIEFDVGDYKIDHLSGGYSYFSGTPIKSAADLGRYLKKRDDGKSITAPWPSS